MNKDNKTFALVVHACDRYELLYKGFEHFFSLYWPYNENINNYFFTENKEYQFGNFKNIQTGKAEWSDRLRKGLQQLSEPYIIYVQEDMWLNKPVVEEVLDGILNYVSYEKPLLLKLHSSEVYKTKPSGKTIEGLQVAELINDTSKYLMSHQLSIWDREFFISQLQKSEHPWRHERKGTKRMKKLNHPIYQIDLFAENGKPPINNNESNINRSEYQTISVNGMLNDNSIPFLNALIESTDSEISSYGASLLNNYENKLTHDGLPKPRKESFIKRITKSK